MDQELSTQDRDEVYKHKFLIACHLQVDEQGKVTGIVPDAEALVRSKVEIGREHGRLFVKLTQVEPKDVEVKVDGQHFLMKPVESSNIAAIGWLPQRPGLKVLGTLLVQFKPGGSYYKYSDVSSETYRNLMSAQSIGSYFNAHIKKSSIKFERVEATPV